MDSSPNNITEDYDRLRAAEREYGVPSVAERAVHLKSLKDAIVLHSEELRNALFADLGKPSLETDSSEIAPIIVEIRHAIRHLKRWTKTRRRRNPVFLPGISASVALEPKGVVLILSPFNYPLNLSMGPLVSAIAAGNRAIVKPSELTPVTSDVVARIVSQSLPDTLASVAVGGIDTARALLALKFDHIFFSGSSRVGKIVMADAAKFSTPVTLELGGKSPALVSARADLDLAVRKIVAGKFLNSGQTCIGVDYALVEQSVYDEFVGMLVNHLGSVYGTTREDWSDSESFGRIISTNHAARLRSLLNASSRKPDNIAFGGQVDVANKFISPTVVTEVDLADPLMSQEIFGPILPIIRTVSIDDSIRIANQLPVPLTVYLFTKSKKEGQMVRKGIKSGALVTNDVLAQFVHPNMPFGGSGASGFGRAHGEAGFRTFSNERALLRNRDWFRSPLEMLYAPYSKKIEKLLQRILKRL